MESYRPGGVSADNFDIAASYEIQLVQLFMLYKKSMSH